MSVNKPSDCEEEACCPLLDEEDGSKSDAIRKKCPGLVRKNRSIEPPADSQSSLTHFITRKRFVAFLVLTVILICLNTTVLTWETTTDRIPVYHRSHVPGMRAKNLPPGFLVYSDKCKMPNMDPYAADVMKHFKRQKYRPCNSSAPLTSTTYDPQKKLYTLSVDDCVLGRYIKSGGTLDCCYQIISRSGKGAKADSDYKLSACFNFTNSMELPPSAENILVKCKSKNHQVYINAHAMIPERPEIRERLNSWRSNDTKRPISILLLGIDSISRQNLIRAMPKTAQHLYDSEWFELSGYNKIDDNTFPNLMAVLAGYNITTAFHKCNPYKVGSLDKCDIMWYNFQKHGYVTAYAEDEASINTFNYLKKGFEKPPTDYYLRPFLLAAETHLPIKRKSTLTFCLGYKHSAEYVYDYALEFATNYKNDSFFGLFWANTFSHNMISDCSSMDEVIAKYLHELSNRGILESSIIVFFSDHGIRFGPTRKLLSGHYEERLPFIFIWLPQWLKDRYPEFVDALNVNKNRLTNPYDIHMTLKHILELSGRAKDLPNAEDCPNCQTLLRPVPHSRSCEDIAIEDHWCTCTRYESVNAKSPIIHKVLTFLVEYINDYVGTYKNGSVAHLCSKLEPDGVKGAYKGVLSVGDTTTNSSTHDSYRVVFQTKPGQGLFEASVRHHMASNEFEITGSISRLNVYAKDSACIGDGGAKKYCFCTKSSHGAGRKSG